MLVQFIITKLSLAADTLLNIVKDDRQDEKNRRDMASQKPLKDADEVIIQKIEAPPKGNGKSNVTNNSVSKT